MNDVPTVPAATILIVDADGLSRIVADQVLRHRGFRTLTAASVSEALRLCSEEDQRVDLVVIDIENTGAPGPTVVDRLRRRYPSLPAVYVSRMAVTPPPASSATDRASETVLVKPFGVTSFIAAVREKLGRGSLKGRPG